VLQALWYIFHAGREGTMEQEWTDMHL